MTKANSAPAPFTKLRGDIFRNKDNLRGAADELVLRRSGMRCDQCEHRGPIRRRDGYPALAGWKAGVESQS